MQALLRIAVFFMFIYYTVPLFAQEKKDATLILTHDFTDSLMFKKRNVSFGIGKSNNYILRYNPVSLVFSGLMYTYQKWISQQISADCLYSPSCSEYSKLLFHEYGFFKGIFTSADRLMRCDRISATTINPISINEKDGKVHESVLRYRIKSK
jgi:putative component of membrane protein insertase Oxa1/YidC/SpoIIIJ protein YidD